MRQAAEVAGPNAEQLLLRNVRKIVATWPSSSTLSNCCASSAASSAGAGGGAHQAPSNNQKRNCGWRHRILLSNCELANRHTMPAKACGWWATVVQNATTSGTLAR